MTAAGFLLIPFLLAGMQGGEEEPTPTPESTPPPMSEMEGVDLAPDATERLPQVGILVLSDDALEAGKLQSSLLQFGRRAKLVDVVPPEALALRIHDGTVEPAPTVDVKAIERAKAFLGQAIERYYDGKFANALERLGRVSALTEEVELPTSARIELYLWRAAVFLALEDQRQARANARAALVLDPEVHPDLAVFPPQVGALVDRLRPSVRTSTLLLHDLPADAVVELDGREVTSPLQVTHGPHTLRVRAPGYRTVSVPLKIRGDRSASVPIAVRVPETAEDEIDAAVWSESKSVEMEALSALATRGDVNVWLLGAVHGAKDGGRRVRVAVLDVPTGTTLRTADLPWNPAQELAIAEAAATLLQQIPDIRRKAGRHEPTGEAWVWNARVAASFQVQQLALGDADSDALRLRLAGAGPHVDGWWQSSLWRVGLEGGWTTYQLSRINVTYFDGSTLRVPGGQTFDARLYGGYYAALPFGSDVRAGGGLALGGELHRAEDVPTIGGDPSGLLADYLRVSPEVWVGASAALSQGIDVTLSGSYSPFAVWRATPRGTYGNEPADRNAASWQAGVIWSVTPSMRIALDYRGQIRQVQFQGTGSSELRPSLEDAHLFQMFHGGTIAAMFGF